MALDADQQNAPSEALALLAKLDEGVDVVSGWRGDRQDLAIARVLPSLIAGGLISRISGAMVRECGCTLQAGRRKVVYGMRLYGEIHRFIPAEAWRKERP